MNEIVGIEQLSRSVSERPATVELEPSALTAQLYAALKLSSCWCTQPVWYAPKATPIKCSRCKAVEEYERQFGGAI